MAIYSYVALDDFGRREEGRANFPTESAALDDLSQKGLTVIQIERVIENEQATKRYSNSRLSLFEEAVLAEQLATLFEAAISPSQIAHLLGKTSNSKQTSLFFARVEDFLNEGVSFPDALERIPGVLSRRFVALSKLSHISNNQAVIFRILAADLRRKSRLIREVRSAAVYPTLLVSMAFAIIVLMSYVLGPELEVIFASNQTELPFALSIFVWIRAILGSYFFWSAFGLAILIANFRLRSGAGINLSAFFRRTPLIGPILIDLDAAEIARGTALIMQTGSGLADALREVATVFPENHFSEVTEKAAASVFAGGTAWEVFDIEPKLSGTYQQLFTLAETTNRFLDILPALSGSLEEAAEARLKRLMQLISPSLTLALGLGIGLLVYSIMSAIMAVNDVTGV
jgi:general secretion pathway protein F